MTEAKASTFTVPGHVDSLLFGGGCGEAHFPNAKGEITCKVCAPLAAAHHFPPDPRIDPAAPVVEAAPDAPAKDAKKASAQITDPKE